MGQYISYLGQRRAQFRMHSLQENQFEKCDLNTNKSFQFNSNYVYLGQ